MAYAPPDRATFIAIFPAFEDVTDAQYDFWSAQAALITGPLDGCLSPRTDLATMLLTAHYLTQAGIGSGTESVVAAQGASGYKRIKSGTIDLERTDAADVDASMGEYGATSYGRQLFPMLKSCLGGPLVTATGAMCSGGFNGFAGPLPPHF